MNAERQIKEEKAREELERKQEKKERMLAKARVSSSPTGRQGTSDALAAPALCGDGQTVSRDHSHGASSPPRGRGRRDAAHADTQQDSEEIQRKALTFVPKLKTCNPNSKQEIEEMRRKAETASSNKQRRIEEVRRCLLPGFASTR